jgi:parallel beta-helix repeat protein
MNIDATRNLGKYQILGELGKGGFATVYRARDPDLGREVALKVLDPLLTRDPVWVARFRREAWTVASLDHPRVVTVHEIGQAEGSLYIAMRLVEGGSLRQRIEAQGALPWDEVVRLAGQIADALDFAHGQGVLHRDLKPANVLLDPRLGAVLTDFGFASLVADNSLSISMSGGVVGTPAYIAPEVWEGDDPTPQTDVYALGCIVYELATGQMLFTGASTPAVMRAHFQPRKLPETWPDGTPPGLSDVLLAALAQEPVDRYATAGDLVAAIAGLREDPLAAPYAELQTAVEAGRWQEALALAGQVRAVDAGYLDVVALEAAAQAGLREEQLAAPYGQLQAAVEGGRWQEALALAGQVRAVDAGYRDVAALEGAALAGLERTARVQQAAGWREEAERALHEGDLKGASLAASKWQELTPDDPAAAELQAKLKHDRGVIEAVQLQVEAAHVLAADTTQDARPAVQHLQELAQDDSSQEALRASEQKSSHQVRPDLVVSPFGGQYTSIQAAIDDAHPGAIIEIRPAAYVESLTIDKDVHLVGVGPREQIIIEAKGDDVIRFFAQQGTLRNLTLRLTGRTQSGLVQKILGKKTCYTMDIAAGELLVDGCDVSSDVGTVIAVRSGANPTIRNSRIHDGGEAGVFVYEGGEGEFEENDIFGNMLAGVVVVDNCSPHFRRNRILAGKSWGVHVYDGGRGEFRENEIVGSTYSGFHVEHGGDPLVIKNRIHSAQTSGVLISDDGLGTFEENDIFGNALTGVEVRKGANPTIRNNRICEGHGGGVLVYDNGQGIFEENDIYDNALAGVEVRTGASPTVRNNRIHNGQQGGVYVHDNGRGVFEENYIFGNALAGVEVRSGASPTVRNNHINGNGYEGIWVYEGGCGSYDSNDLSSNTLGPWDVSADSEVTRRNNRE